MFIKMPRFSDILSVIWLFRLAAFTSSCATSTFNSNLVAPIITCANPIPQKTASPSDLSGMTPCRPSGVQTWIPRGAGKASTRNSPLLHCFRATRVASKQPCTGVDPRVALVDQILAALTLNFSVLKIFYLPETINVSFFA